MSRQITLEYKAVQTHLNEMNVPTTKGLAELSLWGRVSAALDEKDSRIAALEADKKRLVEALRKEVEAVEIAGCHYHTKVADIHSESLALLFEVS